MNEPSSWKINLLLLVAVLLQECSSQGLHCYQCGSDDGDALPCDLFAVASMWRQFAVECPESPPHFCAKTITYRHHEPDDERSEVRGCAAAENAYQVANPVGCSQSGHTIMCLCNSTLCNGATCVLASTSLLTFCLITIYLTCYFFRD